MKKNYIASPFILLFYSYSFLWLSGCTILTYKVKNSMHHMSLWLVFIMHDYNIDTKGTWDVCYMLL